MTDATTPTTIPDAADVIGKEVRKLEGLGVICQNVAEAISHNVGSVSASGAEWEYLSDALSETSTQLKRAVALLQNANRAS